MLDSPMEILTLVASGVIGYLLGAIPFAQWVSRYIKGVDIFSTGTTLAGTANVREKSFYATATAQADRRICWTAQWKF